MGDLKLPLSVGAVRKFVAFTNERERIRLAKEAGGAIPWTKDPVLATYRFTNVHREHDLQTRLIARGWREPHMDDPDVWFAMCVARLVNWWPTLEEVGYPVPWVPKRFVKALGDRMHRGSKVFTGAYMINQSIPGGAGMLKHAYLAEYVLTPLWEKRKIIRPRKGDSLHHFYSRLRVAKGMGSFMAAQVVADTKYTGPLQTASDWVDFAAPGPGSQRGLNIVYGRDPKTPWRDADWHAHLLRLGALYHLEGGPKVHAQDLQNCLCEYSKYVRGSSRTKYVPSLSEENLLCMSSKPRT